MPPRGRGSAWGCLRLIPRGCRTVFLVSVLLVGLLLYTLMHTPMRLTTPALEGGAPPRPARTVSTQRRSLPTVQLRDGEGTGGATTPVRQYSRQHISCPTYVGPGFDFKCVTHAPCRVPATVVGFCRAWKATGAAGGARNKLVGLNPWRGCVH